MNYYPGFDIKMIKETMEFTYGKDVFGPVVEKRYLNDIRSSLADPHAQGPELLYSIAMDTGKIKDKKTMEKMNLLYGVVAYSKGMIGEEPVRSQGHIHAISLSCNASTCEVYEIFEGEAYIYMQESGEDHAKDCYAVYAKEGEVVIVPPGWVHATINANPKKNMVFGAWCVRDYGFDYDLVKQHHGIAFFPKVKGEKIIWKFNSYYKTGNLKVIKAISYELFGLDKKKPIYTQFEENPDIFKFVSQPNYAKDKWSKFKEIMRRGETYEV